MSTIDYSGEVSEVQWEQYLSWCRANSVPATVGGFQIWQSDSDLDEPEWQ